MNTHSRIDTHHHFIPPFYRKILDEFGLLASGWPIPAWDPQATIDFMGKTSIATSILSLSSPSVCLLKEINPCNLARQVNEYAAELVNNHPNHFGQFACLPLCDIDGAITEAIYALDELHVDGVILFSNMRGTYLGDACFDSLWAELNARSAVVFIHPIDPPIEMLKGLPSPLIDFPFDTTRTALHMVANGVMRRYDKIKVILSHGGGFLPYAAYRAAAGIAFLNLDLTIDSVIADMKRFYFDTALSSSSWSLPSLLAFADPTHITFGSDFPFAPFPAIQAFNDCLDKYSLSVEQRNAINRGNAEMLFPRFSSTA